MRVQVYQIMILHITMFGITKISKIRIASYIGAKFNVLYLPLKSVTHVEGSGWRPDII